MVFISGNGIRDTGANNIMIANIPRDENGNLIQEKVGQPVEFKNLKDWVLSGNEGRLISNVCNYGVPGCNDMSLTHDPLATYLKKEYPNIPTLFTNQMTIPPAYGVNIYGLIGKPVNMLIDYLETPAYTINLPKITAPVPTISIPDFNFNQKEQ